MCEFISFDGKRNEPKKSHPKCWPAAALRASGQIGRCGTRCAQTVLALYPIQPSSARQHKRGLKIKISIKSKNNFKTNVKIRKVLSVLCSLRPVQTRREAQDEPESSGCVCLSVSEFSIPPAHSSIAGNPYWFLYGRGCRVSFLLVTFL